MPTQRKIISFLNMKGGVCKTTLCKEMAVYLSQENKVLIIDIDPQANCTQSFFERYNVLETNDDQLIIEMKKNIPSIEKIFSPSKGKLEGPKLEEVVYKLTDNLHIIPGELHTIFMERETGSGASEQRLSNFIEESGLAEQYKYIFIDCPPTYSFYTIAALLASDYYLVPVTPDAYSLLGVNLLEDVVEQLRNTYKANFKLKPIDNLGIIFTKIATNPSAGVIRNMDEIRQIFKDKGIFFFENSLLRADKIATSKLSVFIEDRQDEALHNNLKSICEEFIEVVKKGEQQESE